ncbi:carbohydrate ABC transporter permease [Clostridium estertheticum]|uniref:carbohydrate ABC transporter permease n=1 Tax=Clostridium estertheticum TaxID=238834 RepID=UPI001CF10C18|nr:sugar ABC transporter permease [Clostridium estertheticum]MCB2340703.1 sugar ABC transporter permease [Clostridium estertheticum]
MVKGKINREKYGLLFIAPFFITFLIFQLYPMIYSLYVSFIKWDGMSKNIKFVGLANYSRLFADPVFLKSIANTWIMWLCGGIPQLILALILAVVLNEARLKGKDIFRAVYFFPNLVTATSIGILFAFLFDWQAGSVNKILMNIHLIKEPINFLMSENYSRGIVSLTSFWMWFGYSMIIFMAGIKNIPEELYEAATVDGASKTQRFCSITIPLLRPTILFSFITSLIGGMQSFDIPYALSKGAGDPNNATMSMVMYLYRTAFVNNNYGYGAAVGYALFIIILVFAIISFKFINRNADDYE